MILLAAGTSACGMVETAREPYRAAPPSPVTPWKPSAAPADVRPAPGVARPRPDVPLDKPYALVDLIDLAQRTNPETRRAWEEARAAAARRGQAAAAYFPSLVVATVGGQSRVVDRGPDGTFTVEGQGVVPQARLGYLVLDFGRRDANIEVARQELLGANLAFNRKHQEITYLVSRSYFTFGASREQVAAQRATLDSATAVERAVNARFEQGLATRPDLLLAIQEKARAAFELQRAMGTVEDARAALADSIGIEPTVPIEVVDVSSVPLPDGLTTTVEQVIDRALARRPDLAQRLADLRAREAAQKRARADFWPTLSFSGTASQHVARYNVSGVARTFTESETGYGALLSVDWNLFDGFARENAVREATSRRNAAAADLAASELKAVREVWKAYADVKTALAKYEFAQALLTASEQAYAATLESYEQAGLATVLDLLAATRDLANARSTALATRAEVLTTTAALAFAAGD